MTSRQHSPLVIIERQGSRVLQPVPLRQNGSSSYDEAWIRDLIFANPLSIPVHEVDPAFGPLIPVCTELETRIAGPADAFFINPLGMPTLVECKLWRNPEARREVVGQILDYARVLRKWTYADLQREAARARKEQGFDLADFVKSKAEPAEFDEAGFCDNVSRNLARGRILLLIIGDGIREGVEAIADYVQGTPGLHFTLGLVEAQVFEIAPDLRIVQPRVLARTVILNRTVVELASPGLEIVNVEEAQEDKSSVHQPDERQQWMRDFWTELLNTVKLDDVEQPLPKPMAESNIFFPLPVKGNMWLTCYFVSSRNVMGIFLGMNRTSTLALEIGNRLEADRAEIDREFAEAGLEVRWQRTDNGKVVIGASKQVPSIRDASYRDEELAWFKSSINAFVNVLRPRIARLIIEVADGGERDGL